MILTVTLNPSLDHTLFVEKLTVGDTNRVMRQESDAGGKGLNLSRIAAQLEAKTLATGFLGGANGAAIAHVLTTEEVAHECVPTEAQTRSNLNVEPMDGAPPTTLNSKGPLIQPGEWASFKDHFCRLLPQSNWVCLCGSIPPGVQVEAYAQLTRLASELGKRVLVDADGDAMHHAMAERPHLIKPNKKEAERLLGGPIPDPVQAADQLRKRLAHPDAMVIISLGADGAALASAQGTFLGESPTIEAVSSVGSGDSMLGAFLARLEAGDEPESALRWGLAAGAATATTNGSHIGRRAVIELLYARAVVRRVS